MKKTLLLLVLVGSWITWTAKAVEWPDASFNFVTFNGPANSSLANGDKVDGCTINLTSDGAVSVTGSSAGTKFQNGSGAADSVRTYFRINLGGAETSTKIQSITLPTFTLTKDGSVTVYAAPTGVPSADTGRGITVSTSAGKVSATGDWKKTERYTLIGVKLELPAGTYSDVRVVAKGGGMLIYGVDKSEGSTGGGDTDETIVTFYDSKMLSANASFIAPDWMRANGNTSDSVAVIAAKKVTVAEAKAAAFYGALNLTSTLAEFTVYGIKIAQNDDRTSYMTLDLQSCESVTVTYWGTGGRGMLIENDANASTVTTSAASYVVGTASLDVKSTGPVKVKLTPRNDKGAASTGDTFINQIIITQKSKTNSAIVAPSNVDKGEPIAVEYYDITGRKALPQAKGVLIKKSTFSDGSVETGKIYLK